MQLYYSSGSPYARVVRMALLETGIVLPQVETTLRDPASTLLPLNPVHSADRNVADPAVPRQPAPWREADPDGAAAACGTWPRHGPAGWDRGMEP